MGKSILDRLFDKMIEEYDFMSVVMYPELKNRRDFVHDSWLIAKSIENEEFKLAVASDPYFYLNREDLLSLCQTNDNKLITFILKNKVRLHIMEDIGYLLVAIKKEQVDKN